MKKYILAFLGFGLLLAAVPAMAEPAMLINGMTDRTGRNDFGLEVAGALADDNINDAYYIGANWSHGLNEWWALGLEAGWQGSDFDVDTVTSSNGELNVVTVFGDVILRLPMADWAMVPYGVVGAGVLHAYTDTTSDNDDETAFAMKFGAGFDWFLTRNWILNFEAAYIATGGDLPAAPGVTANLDHWRIGGGLKYAF